MSTAPADEDQPIGKILDYPRGGPTVLRILLGTQLRRLREARGISALEAGEAIRGSHSKISRMELGRVGFKKRDVVDLLALYGAAPDECEAMLSLLQEANKPGWWHRYGDVLPQWVEVYLALEEAAELLRSYEAQLVPGLLQTEDYARAVIRLRHPDAPTDELEQHVGLRMTRRQRLTGPEPPILWAVVDEAVLRRPVGGRQAMRAQLEHLVEITELPNVILQVVPFHAGGRSAAGGPFTVLRFAESALPDVVYLEQLSSALYLDKARDVELYLRVMNDLCVAAVPPEGTTGILTGILKDL